MSRIGNHPIPLPAKVEVTLAPGAITVKGPLGSLTRTYGSELTIEKNGDTLVCKAANEAAKPMHGTLRGMNITIPTTARTDAEAKALLAAFRFPFKN